MIFTYLPPVWSFTNPCSKVLDPVLSWFVLYNVIATKAALWVQRDPYVINTLWGNFTQDIVL